MPHQTFVLFHLPYIISYEINGVTLKRLNKQIAQIQHNLMRMKIIVLRNARNISNLPIQHLNSLVHGQKGECLLFVAHVVKFLKEMYRFSHAFYGILINMNKSFHFSVSDLHNTCK